MARLAETNPGFGRGASPRFQGRNSVQRHRGFTLVEIMVVIFIIGLLLSIALPNFITQMNISRGRACQKALKDMVGAKERWAMDGGHGPSSTPEMGDLVGVGNYLRDTPKCPAGGAYTLNSLDTFPTCTIGGPSEEATSHRVD